VWGRSMYLAKEGRGQQQQWRCWYAVQPSQVNCEQEESLGEVTHSSRLQAVRGDLGAGRKTWADVCIIVAHNHHAHASCLRGLQGPQLACCRECSTYQPSREQLLEQAMLWLWLMVGSCFRPLLRRMQQDLACGSCSGSTPSTSGASALWLCAASEVCCTVSEQTRPVKLIAYMSLPQKVFLGYGLPALAHSSTQGSRSPAAATTSQKSRGARLRCAGDTNNTLTSPES
jgi:hypothetical protein